MIYSRRISKPLYNQFALLRFDYNTRNHRRYSLSNLRIVTNIRDTKNLNKTYPLIPIAETSFRYVSISASISAQTKIMKGEGDHGLNLYHDDILKAQKDESVLIIDVREDAEIKETGKLPGSIHVPMGEVADVFKNFSKEAFLEKFQKPKPTKDTKLIFSCRSGKRSAAVQEAMIKLGYEKSYNYTGGWLDWESKQTPTA